MSTHLEEFTARMANRTAVIGVVGLGYVGLPVSMRFAEAGFQVIGFDVDPEKVDRLNRGESYIGHFSDAQIGAAIGRGMLATTDLARSSEADALLLCLPTPLRDDRTPDLSFVIVTVDGLVPHLRAGQVMALESTTYPGTTEEELAPRIEAAGLAIGQEVFLVYSPEREDPGNTRFSTRTIPKVVGGATAACLEAGIALYGAVIDRVVPVSSTRVAEMTKLLENVHRAVNIGLVNELKVVCDRMGIDIYEVIEASATKPFGFVPYWPGPGLGGHCIPIDPFYLTWKARQYGVDTRFIELAGEVNSAMPAYVVDKVVQALGTEGKALADSRILVLGIAYKPDVDDTRESPAAEIMQQLREQGAEVAYSDPHVPEFPAMRRHRFDLASVELNPATLASYDCVVVCTHHAAFDYGLIERHARLIVDARGVYRGRGGKVFSA